MCGKSPPVRKAGKNLEVALGYPFRSLGGTTSPLVIHNLDRVYQDSDLAMTGCSVSILRKMTTTNRSGREGASVKYVGESAMRSEEHTSELQSLMRISYAVFCLKNNSAYSLHRSYYLAEQITYKH